MKKPRLSRPALLTLVLLFGLCQVAGAMCPPPQGPTPSQLAVASDEPMSCSMPTGSICQPQLTSSHERHGLESQILLEVDQQSAIIPFDGSVALRPLNHPVIPFFAALPSVVSRANALQVLRI
ncbi:MAG: hypothetical protein C4293_08885 [Nitrospiraceae bacterium]